MKLECGYCNRMVNMHPGLATEYWFPNHLFECNGCASKRYERQWNNMTKAERDTFIRSVDRFGPMALFQ